MTYSQLQHEPNGAVLLLTGQWNLSRIAEIDAELGAAGLPSSPITTRRLAAPGDRYGRGARAARAPRPSRGDHCGADRRQPQPRARDRGGARAHGRRRACAARRRHRPLAALGVAAVKLALDAALPPGIPRPQRGGARRGGAPPGAPALEGARRPAAARLHRGDSRWSRSSPSSSAWCSPISSACRRRSTAPASSWSTRWRSAPRARSRRCWWR